MYTKKNSMEIQDRESNLSNRIVFIWKKFYERKSLNNIDNDRK